MITITPIYAAALAALFVFLSIRVIGVRRAGKVAVGVAGNSALERAVRVQANFAEYAPLALVLLLMLELQGANAALVHALAAALLAGRCLHAWGMAKTDEDFRFRVAGMALTFSVLLIAAAALLALGLPGAFGSQAP